MQRLNLQLKQWNNCRKLAASYVLTKLIIYDIMLMKIISGGIYNEKDYLQKDL